MARHWDFLYLGEVGYAKHVLLECKMVSVKGDFSPTETLHHWAGTQGVICVLKQAFNPGKNVYSTFQTLECILSSK